MLSDYLTPGDRVEVKALHPTTVLAHNLSTADDYFDLKKTYRTRIYDLLSEDVVSIEMPTEKTKLILLPVGEDFDLCFYTSKGLYQCYARVRDRYKTSNVYILEMELTTNLRKFQRREYYRFNCVLDMSARSLSEDEERKIAEHEVEFIDTDMLLDDGVIVDISGGGARFISHTQYEVNSLILFKFMLDIDENRRPYTLIGRVVMSERAQGRDAFEVRIKFVKIDNKDRESIIKYIFEEERKIRQRQSMKE
ncbi:flagellar brake protein [Lachnospiraceae bacterium C1.1]|nr:flagellar brake protein [Lachnospiraceae bacterium C1.1]